MLGGMHDNISEPLYTQLSNSLRRWITSRVPGDRLPSERWLTKHAGVNRGTMRKALAELVESGLLERGPRGTVIAREVPVKKAYTPHPLHTLAYSRPEPVQTVKVAVYETLPFQRVFWQKTSELLKELEPRVELQLEWVPESVVSLAGYAEFVRAKKCELTVLTGGMLKTFREQDLLVPVPEETLELLDNENTWWRELTADHDPLLPWGVPVHISIDLLLWNRMQLPGTSDLSPTATVAEITEWLNRAGNSLKKPTKLLSQVLQPVEAMGIPPHPMTEPEARFHLSELFGMVERVKECSFLESGKVFMACEATKQFVEGDTAVYMGTSPYILNHLPDSPDEWGCSFIRPEDGYQRLTQESAIAITTQGATNFAVKNIMKHFIGPQIQNLVAETPINCPIRKESVQLFANRVNCPTANLNEILEKSSFMSAQMHEWTWFVQCGIAHLLQALLEGTREVDENLYQEALKTARNSFHFLPDAPGNNN